MNARLTECRRARGLTAALAFLALFAAAPAVAQDDEHAAEEEEERRGRIVTIGGGAQLYPRFPGDDELGIFPMPIVNVRREGDPLPLEAPDEGWGFGILGRDSAVNFGPALAFQSRRRDEDVGAAVGEVAFTIEAGAFVEAYLGETFRLRAEGRRGIGGHQGGLGDLGADLFLRSGNSSIFSIGPRLRLADDDYMDAYFGVTPAVAASTGLAPFNPGGGVHSVGATAGLQFHMGGGIGIHGYARYDRLVGDAGDSPIVASFGSRDQFGAGVGLSYSFTVRRSRRR
jgi:outer membrane scaffolding protein for murein synthesis (MipA/OmpV family)